MSITLAELTADLNELGSALSDPQDILSEIGDTIVAQMKEGVPVATGRLKGSIRWQFNGVNSIEFMMLEYGIYQNYGVKGNAGGYNTQTYHKPFGNSFGGIQQPQFGTGYRNRAFGLPARKFYDETEIGDLLGATFVSELTEDF
tara:strand:+ start:2129 stop:2560 length:432 start_codon:yes stop_codon:yes gene_type:complete